MKTIKLSLPEHPTPKEYASMLCGFIRHAYFFRKKVFKFIGLSVSVNGEKLDSSKLLGGETPQVILLKLNTLNLHNIPEDSTGFVEDGLKLVKVDEDTCEITLKGNSSELDTSVMNCILGEQEGFKIFQDLKPIDYEIRLILHRNCGHVTENENERILEEIFLSRQSGQMITVGTLHTCDLNFGYSIEDNEIILRVDDSLDINDIFTTVKEVCDEVQSLLYPAL